MELLCTKQNKNNLMFISCSIRKSRRLSRGRSFDRSVSRKKSLAKRVSVVEPPKKEVAGEKLIQEEKSQQGQV